MRTETRSESKTEKDNGDIKEIENEWWRSSISEV
jgi:hypothetical protein